MKLVDFLPGIIAGTVVAGLLVAFALGHLPLTGVLYLDSIQATVGFMSDPLMMAVYIGEKALLAFFTTCTSVFMWAKVGSLFNISQQSKLSKLKETEKENTELKREVAFLNGVVEESHHGLSFRSRSVPGYEKGRTCKP